MNSPENSAAALVEQIQKKAPEYLDLLTAQIEEDFENAFDTLLERAISSLEANRKNFEKLDEVALSGALAMALSVPGLTVSQEAHSNGHVDLTIVADHCMPARKMLGEAKIYDGPEYHLQGLSQLLDRYTTGRESRGLLIVYYRKKNILNLIKKVREKMDADRPCKQQGKTVSHAIKWSFLSTHRLTSGDDHRVGHFGCNLCTE